MSFTDIKQIKLIERLPVAVRPYAYLARIDRPTGWWLLLLPGWWAIALAAGGFGAMNADDWRLMGLFLIGAIVMRAAGCVINDLWDRELDRKVDRTRLRPLAAGTINTRQALIFLAALLIIGFAILMRLNLVAVLLGLLSLPLIALYPLMKRLTWWPQAFLGITFNFGALIGWAAVTAVVELPALLLYLSGFFWTLGYDTIYAHQDKDDDILAGVKSSALKLGHASRKWVGVFYILTWLALVAAFVAANAGIISCLLLLPPAAQLCWQVRHWNMDDQESALRMFKSNRDFGLLVLLAAFF